MAVLPFFGSLHAFVSISSALPGLSGPTVYKIMESLPTVILKTGEADRIVAGHPRVYQASILRMTAQPATANWCRSKIIASGCSVSASSIPNPHPCARVRAGTRGGGSKLFDERIAAAFAYANGICPTPVVPRGECGE